MVETFTQVATFPDSHLADSAYGALKREGVRSLVSRRLGGHRLFVRDAERDRAESLFRRLDFGAVSARADRISYGAASEIVCPRCGAQAVVRGKFHSWWWLSAFMGARLNWFRPYRECAKCSHRWKRSALSAHVTLSAL